MSTDVASGYIPNPPICMAGGRGLFLSGGKPFPARTDDNAAGLAILYLICLGYFFLGVAIAAGARVNRSEPCRCTRNAYPCARAAR
jgi:hypothetical protein